MTAGARTAVALWLVVAAGACAPSASRISQRLIQIESQTEQLSEEALAERQAHIDRILTDALDKDLYQCLPPPRLVFAPPPSTLPTRQIVDTLPHYGVYYGPVTYRIGVVEDPTSVVEDPTSGDGPSDREPGSSSWSVQLTIALSPDRLSGGVFEMPDCELKRELSGEVLCEGTAFEKAEGVEACPDSGRFEAPVSRHNIELLLRRWSREAEEYYNRDARHFGLAVRYDFEFVLAGSEDLPAVVDVTLPLRTTCARTPYFTAFRTGWSIPIVAHEVAHFLGLLDEYEPLSGIFWFYPKTPFEGSENSRMGLSMKTHTRLSPLHHYLILRRYHCPTPSSLDPYRETFERAPHTSP